MDVLTLFAVSAAGGLAGAAIVALCRGPRTVYVTSPSHAPVSVRLVRDKKRKPRDPSTYERPKIVPDDHATRPLAHSYADAYEVERRARMFEPQTTAHDMADAYEMERAG